MKDSFKKIAKISTAVVCAAAFTISFAACGGGNNDDAPATTTYTVTFESNGGSDVAAQTVNSGETATRPEDPQREGYEFDDWHSDSSLSEAYNFSSAVTSDITLYAGWDAITYTVTFDYNYEGSTPATEEVAYGGVVERPEDPENGDAVFLGWYTDEDCTEVYDFSSVVTGDMTLYAGWETLGENDNVATFYLNDGTDAVWRRVVFEGDTFYTTIEEQVDDPVAEGRSFSDWYSDADCTEQYSPTDIISDDISVYAGWQSVYTLEAEWTDMTSKRASGYSQSGTGPSDLVKTNNTEHLTASNGYYVGWLYYYGANLVFEVESDMETTVTLEFRLSAAFNSVEATGDDIYVGINYDSSTGSFEQKYDFPMSIPSYAENSAYVMDFSNYTLEAEVTLHEGTNTIYLYINNNTKGVGGTMYAAAPIIDCIYVYTDGAVIEQTTYNPEYGG